MSAINSRWNDRITYMSDTEHYHKNDLWRFPADGLGDCEDYAIAKRQALESHGIYGCFGLCWTETGRYHAVLLVDTSMGVVVFDNRHDDLYLWHELPYKWDKREMEGGLWREILA